MFSKEKRLAMEIARHWKEDFFRCCEEEVFSLAEWALSDPGQFWLGEVLGLDERKRFSLVLSLLKERALLARTAQA